MNTEQSREPTEKEITDFMKANSVGYYEARNTLRNDFNGKPPAGYASWGDYWKSY